MDKFGYKLSGIIRAKGNYSCSYSWALHIKIVCYINIEVFQHWYSWFISILKLDVQNVSLCLISYLILWIFHGLKNPIIYLVNFLIFCVLSLHFEFVRSLWNMSLSLLWLWFDLHKSTSIKYLNCWHHSIHLNLDFCPLFNLLGYSSLRAWNKIQKFIKDVPFYLSCILDSGSLVLLLAFGWRRLWISLSKFLSITSVHLALKILDGLGEKLWKNAEHLINLESAWLYIIVFIFETIHFNVCINPSSSKAQYPKQLSKNDSICTINKLL